MKPLWEWNLAHALLRKPAIAKCWRFVGPAYNALLRSTIYRRGVLCEIGGGRTLRLCVENKRVRPSKTYAAEVDWLLSGVTPGMCVLDVGANIGLLSICLGKAVGPAGRVFAFEPSPVPFGCLQKNVALNGLAQVVSAEPRAVGDRTGQLAFFLNEDPCDTQHSAVRPPGQQLTKVLVETITIDEFCRQRRLTPNVIKIDVEGFEPLVLEGARNVVAQAGSLKLFVELHPAVWPSIGYDPNKFAALLTNLGLRSRPEVNLDGGHILLERT
jgi:FkbM family methyltransferase